MVNFVIIPYPPFIRKVSICFIKLVKLYQTWKPFLKIFIVGSWNWLQSSWRIFFERYFHFLPFEIHISTIAKNRCIYYVNISFYKDICLSVYIVCLPSYFRNPRQAFLTAGRIQLLSVSSFFKFLSFIFVSPFFINSSKFFSKKRFTSVFSFFDCYKWHTK